MSKTNQFAPGNYRYAPGVFQYSAGVAADAGYRIERARFARTVPEVATRGAYRVACHLR